jgi:hypothetical protein
MKQLRELLISIKNQSGASALKKKYFGRIEDTR